MVGLRSVLDKVFSCVLPRFCYSVKFFLEDFYFRPKIAKSESNSFFACLVKALLCVCVWCTVPQDARQDVCLPPVLCAADSTVHHLDSADYNTTVGIHFLKITMIPLRLIKNDTKVCANLLDKNLSFQFHRNIRCIHSFFNSTFF